jgi:magnesium-transporting ATPase (P-type)
VRERLRNNGLSLVFGALLLLSLVGQAFTGQAFYNEHALDAGLSTISLGEYVTSSQFTVDVAENWQSEYLQFLLFVLLTVFLFQRGSTESKPLHKGGRESDKDQKVAEYAGPDSPMWSRQRGWRLSLYSHSLGLTMGLIFVLSWLAQFVAGRSAYNAEQLQERSDPLGWIDYALAPDFWNRTLQNWQSEFLAVGSMVVLSIYLRERGSPESKPVGEPHEATGGEG